MIVIGHRIPPIPPPPTRRPAVGLASNRHPLQSLATRTRSPSKSPLSNREPPGKLSWSS